MIGSCLECGKFAKLTDDHIIPQWFLKFLKQTGVPYEDVTDYEGNNINWICSQCNGRKAHALPRNVKTEILLNRLHESGVYISGRIYQLMRK